MVTHVSGSKSCETGMEKLKCANTVLYCGPASDSMIFVQGKKAIQVSLFDPVSHWKLNHSRKRNGTQICFLSMKMSLFFKKQTNPKTIVQCHVFVSSEFQPPAGSFGYYQAPKHTISLKVQYVKNWPPVKFILKQKSPACPESIS